MVRTLLAARLKDLGQKFDMVDKDLGYELRCADPIPFDAEYTRNLGYGSGQVPTLSSRRAKRRRNHVRRWIDDPATVPGHDRPKTKKMRPRLVDVAGENYEVARRYMIRLERSDFDDPPVWRSSPLW